MINILNSVTLFVGGDETKGFVCYTMRNNIEVRLAFAKQEGENTLANDKEDTAYKTKHRACQDDTQRIMVNVEYNELVAMRQCKQNILLFKALVNYSRLENEEQKSAVLSDWDSEFWKQQDQDQIIAVIENFRGRV